MKTTCSILLVCALCAFLWPTAAAAEQFHVAREAAGSSDNNDGISPVFISGTQGPWKTLQHAAQVAGAGDTVWIYDGDYRNELTGYGPGVIGLENSGASNSPIRFVAAPENDPIVNSILVHDLQWIEIEGITFISRDFELPANWVDMPQVVVDDPDVVIDPDEPWSIREAKVRQKYATYMKMQDFFLTFYTNSIDVKNSSNVVLKDNTISLYTFGIQVRGHSSQILIEKNSISHCTRGIFTWNPSPSITDSVIRDNVIRQCFKNGMQVKQGADGVLIEGNDVRFSGTAHISLQSETTNCTVRHNRGLNGGYYSETMVFPGSSAFNIHTSLSGNIVEQNYAAFQIDETGNDGNGYIVDLMLDGAGVLLRNNVAYRNMGSGIRTVESPNCVIVNNTLVENGYFAVNPRAGVGVSLSRELDVQQIIVNNIFYNNPAGGIKSDFTIGDQILIDHNLYHGPAGVPYIWDGWLFDENVYNSLAEIQDNLGWETNGVDGNPRFGNPRFRRRWPAAAGSLFLRNFRLAANSPAIDSGRMLRSVINDYDGRVRPRGQGYDIGAFESH